MACVGSGLWKRRGARSGRRAFAPKADRGTDRRRRSQPRSFAMRPLDQCSLYTFIDSAYLRGRDPVELAQQLCDGGSDLIQIRAKDVPMHTVRQISEKVAPIVARA